MNERGEGEGAEERATESESGTTDGRRSGSAMAAEERERERAESVRQQFYYRRLGLRNQPPLARSISAESSAGTGGREGERTLSGRARERQGEIGKRRLACSLVPPAAGGKRVGRLHGMVVWYGSGTLRMKVAFTLDPLCQIKGDS